MKSFIVPTANLAHLVYRAIRQRKLPYNYCVGVYDLSGGIWIQLANADWVEPGSYYINPHWRS